MKIASIMCDGENGKDYRRNIYLLHGRLICDCNDISQLPTDEVYPNRESAERDIAAMYRDASWELDWE